MLTTSIEIKLTNSTTLKFLSNTEVFKMDKNANIVELTISAFKASWRFIIFIPIVIFIWTNWLLAPVGVLAYEKQVEVKVPEALNPGLQHFLDIVDPDKEINFEPYLVGKVLDFIKGSKDAAALYYVNNISGLTSAYHEFDVNQNLNKIVKYAFNPNIPYIATMPSSVRLFHWMDDRMNKRASPNVERHLARLDNPVVINGLQTVQITPDLNSGAYYTYSLYQTLLLFRYDQRNVLVTVSKQMDVSTVGKKGYILGEDNDWDYFYSGKTGLTIPALGWVRSYMYDSSAINIYYEIDPDTPVVRCAMFKWLRAGWSGINMVQKKHIHRGLRRFAEPFKEIMEYPQLPAVEVMVEDLSNLRELSAEALRSKMARYSKVLDKRYGSGKPHNKKWPSNLFKNESRWNNMTPEEMESALVIEYMKYAMGKTRPEEVGELLGLKQ
jgi:hypothetical protein